MLHPKWRKRWKVFLSTWRGAQGRGSSLNYEVSLPRFDLLVR